MVICASYLLQRGAARCGGGRAEWVGLQPAAGPERNNAMQGQEGEVDSYTGNLDLQFLIQKK